MLADPRATDALVQRFRRPVVESAAGRRRGRRSGQVSRSTTRACCRDSRQETEMFVGQHAARGSQCGGTAERGLHLRQRTARAALRNSGRLRHALPARDSSESRSARRPAGAGRAAGDHVLSGSHVAGAARQVAAEQYFRLADSAASAGRERDARDEAGHGARRRCANGSPSIARIRRATAAIR